MKHQQYNENNRDEVNERNLQNYYKNKEKVSARLSERIECKICGIEFKNQPKSIPLTKPQSSYKKLEKEMNQPPSDYNSIKSLVENDNNSLKNIDIKKSKNEVKIIPHKKK